MKTKSIPVAAFCFGIFAFSQAAEAKDIVSLGELSWMLQNGYSQATIDDIITDCVADPDCGFGPIAPPNPNDDRIRKYKMKTQQQVLARGTFETLPQSTEARPNLGVTGQRYNVRPISRDVVTKVPEKKRD